MTPRQRPSCQSCYSRRPDCALCGEQGVLHTSYAVPHNWTGQRLRPLAYGTSIKALLRKSLHAFSKRKL